jgi:threonine aldolase
MIDLRSDTVTQPTPAMRAAMAAAEVGDDVYGEDPTVNRLEALAAERLGKEAALFVPTGTMGNLIALLVHAGRGQEVLVSDEAHIYHFEAGGASALGGIPYHPVPTRPDGRMSLDALQTALRPPDDPHQARPAALALENTQNRCGGRVLPLSYLADVREWATRHGLAIHLDGARLFNAAVALDVPVTALTAGSDSVQVCLSKGLAAPAGSLLAGTAAFVAAARRQRKMLGGGMRQAGVLAAAGILALTEMHERLHEDHAHARHLATDLAALPGIVLDPATVETNIIVFELAPGRDPLAFRTQLADAGVRLSAFGATKLRAVTHHGISGADCRQAVATIQHLLAR